jgi:DNA-binding transcriptional ArsR family regulator
MIEYFGQTGEYTRLLIFFSRLWIMRIRKDNKELLENEIMLISDVSDALAHPLRVKILKYIMTQNRNMKPVCTKDLVEEFGYAQATISQHMKKLVLAGLVESKHKEKFNYYYVNLGLLARYVDAAKKFSVD